MKQKTKKDKSEKPIKQYHVLIRWWVRFWRAVKRWWRRLVKRHRDFMARRPHRSLFLTKKRDASRSFKLPGYVRFSNEVWHTLWQNKGLFARFMILYAILSLLIVGTLTQSNYLSIRDSIAATSENLGISELMSIFTTTITSSGSDEATITSQVITGLIFLFGWLVIVWILRYRLSGNKIKLRDAIYNAGSPIAATFLLLLIIVAQLLPFALIMLAYVAVSGVGIINWDVAIENMAAWCALAVIAVLTLYWMATSFIALIIVTNPGVYPLQAIRMAGDVVIGRRLKILLRLLFMVLPLAVLWIVILIPIILLDNWLKLDWLPLVPLFTLILSTVTLTWAASYIYILYRRLIDDDAPPVKK
jgi:hypothetical protein